MSKKTERFSVAVIIASILCVHTLDYEDAVEQHERNCNSKTYVNDNNQKCKGVNNAFKKND